MSLPAFNRFTRITIPYIKFRTIVFWATGFGVLVGLALSFIMLALVSALIEYATSSLGG